MRRRTREEANARTEGPVAAPPAPTASISSALFPVRIVFCQNARHSKDSSSSAASASPNTHALPSQILNGDELNPPVTADTRIRDLQKALSSLSSDPSQASNPIASQRDKPPDFLRLYVGQRLQTKPGGDCDDLTLGEIVREQTERGPTARHKVNGAVTVYWVQDIMSYQSNMDETEYLCDPLRRAEVDRSKKAARDASIRTELSAKKRRFDEARRAFRNGSVCDPRDDGRRLTRPRTFDYSEEKRYEDGGKSHCWGGYDEHLCLRPDGTYLFHSHDYTDGGDRTRHRHAWHGGSWCVTNEPAESDGGELQLWLRHEKKYSTWKGMGDIEERTEWKTAQIKPKVPSAYHETDGQTLEDRQAWLPHDRISLSRTVNDFWGEPVKEDRLTYGTGEMRARVGY